MEYKKTLSTVAVITLYSLSSMALAGNMGDSYAGVQYAFGTYSEDGFPDTNPNILIARYGKYLQDNFAIEGRFGIGMNTVTNTISGVEVDLEVNNIMGVYGLGHIDIGNGSSVYGLVGFSKGEITVSGLGESITDDDSSVSFGFGLNFGSINIEYIQYLGDSDYDLTAISLGIAHKF